MVSRCQRFIVPQYGLEVLLLIARYKEFRTVDARRKTGKPPKPLREKMSNGQNEQE